MYNDSEIISKKNMALKKIGKLTCVGIGPGDPEYLTIKGRNALVSADVVFEPVAAGNKISLAGSILKRSGLNIRNILPLTFSMYRKPEKRELYWNKAAGLVCSYLKKGRNAAFITLGDPSIYSTWIYFERAVKRDLPQVEIEVIPGIITLNAVSARFDIPLLEGKERLALVPLPEDLKELKKLADTFDTIVIYKLKDRLKELIKVLTEMGLDRTSFFARRVGLSDELLSEGLSGLSDKTSGYLSTLIIKRKIKI